jgi:predicted ATPase/DNA-binding CsgD family transcriptional regulator
MGNDAPFDPLSQRERDVLALLAEDLPDRQIAERLVIAYTTVKWYNRQIFNKLGVDTRQQAVQRARELGLLEALEPTQVPRNNLPTWITPFVGRARELEELTRLLTNPMVRLVTILAPGGMGKTRLSLQAARTQLGLYADGVFFVSLAPLNTVGEMVTTIAETLDFNFYGERAPARQLTDFLSNRSLLLLLDNFEHLLEGVDLLTDLLQDAPAVKLLVTSRERLNLRSETLYTLRGLDFPTEETGEEPLDNDAARLFLQSAQRLRPEFTLQPRDLSDLARICRLTAGMPLAIELAAGWVEVLSLEQIAGELQKGIEILESDLRDVPERQRSVRMTFERSWERLSDQEQWVFMHLSVFRGGFTTEAAWTVAKADARSLRRLANKALIQTSPEGRHSIHELLRQYAEDKLEESPKEMQATRDLHAAYYAEFLWQQFARMKTAALVPALEEVETELDNVLIAWYRMVKAAETSLLRKAEMGLFTFLEYRGRFQQALDLLSQTEAVLRSVPTNDEVRAVLGYILGRKAWFYVSFGLPEQAKALTDEGLDLLRQCEYPEAKLEILKSVARIGTYLNTPELSRSAALEGLEIARNMGDPWQILHFLYWSGQTSRILGAYEDALRIGNEGLAISETMGDPWFTAAHSGMLLGTVYRQMGNFVAARAGYERSLALLDPIGQPWIIAVTCGALGDVALAIGDFALARRCYLRRLGIFADDSRQPWETVRTLFGVARLLAAQNHPERAVEILSVSLQHPAILRIHREEAEQLIAELKKELSEERFTAAWAHSQKRQLNALISELILELTNE